MLAEPRRRRIDAAWRVRQFDGNAENLHRANRRMLELGDHLPRRDLRIREQFLEIAHRSARHAGRAEPIDPVLPRLLPQSIRDDRPQVVVSGYALAIGREARILVEPGHRAELVPLIVGADREHELAVGRRERFVGHDARMAVAQAARDASAREKIAGLIREQRHHRVEHRDVHVLPAAGSFTREQRHRGAVRGKHTRHDVGNRHAEAERRTLRGSRDAHQAALALHHGVVSRLMASRSGLPESRDRAIHEARMRRVQRVEVEPHLGERARAEILDQHIAFRDEPVENRAPVGLLEIQRDAFFVSIDAQEIGALALVRGVPIARTLRDGVQEGRSPGARVIALARLLDLDDASAHVGQQHRAVRAGEHARQIEHRDAVERSHNQRMIIVYAGSA